MLTATVEQCTLSCEQVRLLDQSQRHKRVLNYLPGYDLALMDSCLELTFADLD